MNFPLDTERIDQIIFAMEDQKGSYGIDPETGELSSDLEKPLADRLVPIPEWGPADGFQLMERFVAGLRNPLLREQLKDALDSGRGVFRKFKDILKTRREVERLWFSFKEREMRRVVREWYSDQRELAGLRRLPEEPEESMEEAAELAASDFAVRPGRLEDLETVLALDRDVFAEGQPDAGAAEATEERREASYLQRRGAAPDPLSAGSLLRVAETPDGEFAGFVWAVDEEDPVTARKNLRIEQLAVSQSFRGIGVGRFLLGSLAREARDRGYYRLVCGLSGAGLRLDAALRRLGFTVRSVLYELDPGTWEG